MTDRSPGRRRSPDRRPTITIEGMGDRGVSDAIGFVLVFGIIVSTIGVVYVAGFRSLDDARQFERMNNAERAFDVLDDNVEDVTHRGAPSRATEVKLGGATLRVGEPIVVNVTVERASDPSKNGSWEFAVSPIVFQATDSNAVVYSMGASFRESRGGTTMTGAPGFVLSSDRVHLPIVRTRPISGDSLSGSTTVLIRTEQSTSQILASNDTASNVVVNVSTPRADAWRTYFQNNGPASTTCPAATNNDTFVSCEMADVDRVFLTYVLIDFEYAE